MVQEREMTIVRWWDGKAMLAKVMVCDGKRTQAKERIVKMGKSVRATMSEVVAIAKETVGIQVRVMAA